MFADVTFKDNDGTVLETRSLEFNDFNAMNQQFQAMSSAPPIHFPIATQTMDQAFLTVYADPHRIEIQLTAEQLNELTIGQAVLVGNVRITPPQV